MSTVTPMRLTPQSCAGPAAGRQAADLNFGATKVVPASRSPAKRLRILTDRKNKHELEAIEWDAAHRQFFWYAEDAGMIACFPCDQGFAAEKFAECGRVLDVTKLPNWPMPAPSWWRRLLTLLDAWTPSFPRPAREAPPDGKAQQ